MAFYKASTNEEDVRVSSNYINQSGIYPVTLLAPVVNVSEGGSTTVDFYVDYQGQKQMIYGNLRLTNNDGSENKIGSKLFNQLLVVLDIDAVADPVEMKLPIGKDKAEKKVAVLEDLMDQDVLIRVQMEYSVWNDVIQERKVIRGFYRAEDNATAEEIVLDSEPGAQYEKDLGYSSEVTYKDDLTEEKVKAWIANGRNNKTGGKKSKAKPTTSFGKRRFGKK